MGKPLLEGKVAVITGGSAGIGLAIARRFAAEGASLLLAGRNEARGLAAESELRQSGARAVFVPLDVSREEDVQRGMERAVAEFGTLNILVNNAGPNGDDFGLGALHELNAETFDRTMKVGAYGAFLCCKYAIPAMIAAGGGAMVHISAVAAVRALPYMGGYAMAKAVVEALSRQVANDYAHAKIRSNTVLAGTIRPEKADVSTLPPDFDTAKLDGAIARTTMLGRVGRYAEIAEAALFLGSPLSQYITGASLPVEGGALAKMQYPDYSDVMS